MQLKKVGLAGLFVVFLFLGQTFAQPPVPDVPFVQEFHRAYPIGQSADSNDVRTVAVDAAGTVWAGTKVGLFRLQNGTWQSVGANAINGPVYDLFLAPNGTLWVGAWNGLYTLRKGHLKKIEGVKGPIAAVCVTPASGLALGPESAYRLKTGKWVPFHSLFSRDVRQILSDGTGGFWIATGMGLYHETKDGMHLYQLHEEILSADVKGVAFAPDGSLWAAGLGGVTVYKNGQRVKTYTPEGGLPTAWTTCVAQAPDGRMWVGTRLGVTRFAGKGWSLRHSRRWLLNDNVRDVAFGPDDTAWIATAGGVSAIARRKMTLLQKAAYFQRICLKRHVRTPGLVEKCRLLAPGDSTHWLPRDDDNDGQYTAMYLAMQSFHYAVTKDPRVKALAKQAYDALEFLQTVTQTPGFVARTVVPAAWKTMADPNRTLTPQEWADREVHDPRDKRVEKQWRLSADGQWRWKGDTSSDEITGHQFGYLFYYDFVADAKEKARIRDHWCRVVDFIVKNGYVLKDIDGKPTRWGIWSPEKLNHDPDWAAERGINSLEILAYLKLAYHFSGNLVYEKYYRELLTKYHYAENVRHAKTYEPSWRTHIDDELLALTFPVLLLYEKDPELHRLYRESLDWWYKGLKADRSPFFDFVYGALSGTNPQPQVSVAALRDASLDLVRWRVDNSRREDLHLVRKPELESIQTDHLPPLSERGVMRWDNNPWAAVQGDGGWTESSGAWWLLPYWMGRYYGFISESER